MGLAAWLQELRRRRVIRALRQRDSGIQEILMSPWLALLRGDPRFVSFAQKLGFSPEVARK